MLLLLLLLKNSFLFIVINPSSTKRNPKEFRGKSLRNRERSLSWPYKSKILLKRTRTEIQRDLLSNIFGWIFWNGVHSDDNINNSNIYSEPFISRIRDIWFLQKIPFEVIFHSSEFGWLELTERWRLGSEDYTRWDESSDTNFYSLPRCRVFFVSSEKNCLLQQNKYTAFRTKLQYIDLGEYCVWHIHHVWYMLYSVWAHVLGPICKQRYKIKHIAKRNKTHAHFYPFWLYKCSTRDKIDPSLKSV